MIITTRPVTGDADLAQIAALVEAFPAEQLHVVDMPYRLASWSLDNLRNVRLWLDGDGSLMAFGIIQLPWLTLDAFVHPKVRTFGVETAVMVWAAERMQEVAGERGEPISLFLHVLEEQRDRVTLLTQDGYQPADWTLLPFARPLGDIIPRPQYPDGFAARRLRHDELEAYVALHRAAFGTTNMTVEWRHRTRVAPQHIPELDIVVTAPGGELAAFCVSWLSADQRRGQVEPLGVHPRYQGLGLGRAVLLEALWRLQAHGAQQALVTTYSDDTPAVQLYSSAGFRPVYRTMTYARTFG